MNVSNDDKLFHFFKDGQDLHGRKFSYYAWETGYISSFEKYITGYTNAAEIIIQEYKKTSRNDILDTIVYPLCFIYRHIVELNIKYLYFKYSNDEKDKKSKFLEKVNHGLQRAWNKTKPHILLLYKKTECDVDLEIIESYVKQLDEFDNNSFIMRYPIEKNLNRTNPKHSRLDVLSLHIKIMKMVAMFQEIDCQISRVVRNNTLDIELVEKMTCIFKECKNDIKHIIDILDKLSYQDEKESAEDELPEGFISIGLYELQKPNEDETEIYELIMELPAKHACLLGLLSCAGLDILYGDPLLSVNCEDRKEDFFKYLEIVLVSCNSFLNFDGKYSNNVMCYALLEKIPSLMYKALKASFDLMEFCLDETH